jgi:hypothetical protein
VESDLVPDNSVPPDFKINITIVWQSHSTGEDGFEVWKKTGANGIYARMETVASGINAAVDTDSGLYGGTTYFYKVRAYGNGGFSDFSNERSITPSAFPSGQDPISLSGAPGILNETLTWYNRAGGNTPATDFVIEYSLFSDFRNPFPPISVALTGINTGAVLTYTVTDLLGGYNYYFRVKMQRSTGGYSSYATSADNTSLNYIEGRPFFDPGLLGGGGGGPVEPLVLGLSGFFIWLKRRKK